ncbi:hypothetical protein GCM10020216_106460 [Nonomuraea helvata]
MAGCGDVVADAVDAVPLQREEFVAEQVGGRRVDHDVRRFSCVRSTPEGRWHQEDDRGRALWGMVASATIMATTTAPAPAANAT